MDWTAAAGTLCRLAEAGKAWQAPADEEAVANSTLPVHNPTQRDIQAIKAASDSLEDMSGLWESLAAQDLSLRDVGRCSLFSEYLAGPGTSPPGVCNHQIAALHMLARVAVGVHQGCL